MSNNMIQSKINKEQALRRWMRSLLIAIIVIIGFLALSKAPATTTASDSEKAGCQTCTRSESCASSKTRTP